MAKLVITAQQLKTLNTLHNQAPSLFVASLQALNAIKPGGIAAYKKQPPVLTLNPGAPRRKFSPMGSLGTTTSIFGNTSLIPGATSVTTTSAPATTASTTTTTTGSSSFVSDLSSIFNAALPSYLTAKYVAPVQEANAVTTAETSSLLSKMGITNTLSALMPVLLIGGGLVAFLAMRKKKT